MEVGDIRALARSLCRAPRQREGYFDLERDGGVKQYVSAYGYIA